MKPLSDALAGLNARRPLVAPDPESPEEIERWLIDRRLWPTSRIAADLEVARAELRDRHGGSHLRDRLQASAVASLERDLELGHLRDRLQAARPDGCWCFGIGGHGRVGLPTEDGEPLLSWRVWCSCPEAEHLRIETQARRAEIERSTAQATLDRLWGSLPARYAEWSFETLRVCSSDHARLADRVADWLDDGDRWLFLYGQVGRGKTGAAVSALKALAERGQTALFQETSQLLDRLRLGYANLETFVDSRDALWESLFSVQVLLIDDLGAERHRPTEAVDWATEKIWQLIGYRHREERRTIVTSNLDLGGLREHLGHARIPSRIEEVALVLECSGLPNLRTRTTDDR